MSVYFRYIPSKGCVVEWLGYRVYSLITMFKASVEQWQGSEYTVH